MKLTEVCRLCVFLPGLTESCQTVFSPGKDKGRKTEEINKSKTAITHSFTENYKQIVQEFYPPEEFFDGGIAVCGGMELLQE